MPVWSDSDLRAMGRALRLATLSQGRTWPNPGVGCVIVREGVVLGEGRHAVYGQAHAEVNALSACRTAGCATQGATAYVTLAPCTRQGRQGPCVAALVAARVGRVVAAMEDANQDDAGPQLAAAGIGYATGCLAEVAAHVHGGFLTRIALGRPRLTGKWAMSLDGSLATRSGDARWISSPEALALSRRRRRAFDAILVGAGTVAADDPLLLSSMPGERTPVRVVVSRGAAVETDRRLAASVSQAPVLVIHAPDAPAWRLTALRAARLETLAVEDPHDPLQVATALGRRGFNEVLVEGGGRIHGAWLRAGLYDRLEVYCAAVTLGGGQGVCAGDGVESVRQGGRWVPEEAPRLLGGTICWRLKRPGKVADLAPVVVVG